MTARFYRLTELHAKLDEALRREAAKRVPDHLTLTALKRRKLWVKDMLTRLAFGPLRPAGAG